MKCITLEYPDGSIGVRGGLGAVALASFLVQNETGWRARPDAKQAQKILSASTLAQREAARDAALQYILENLVPAQNSGVVARIEDIEFPGDKEFRPAWRRNGSRIIEDLTAAKAVQIERVREAKRRRARELMEREFAGEDVAVEKAALRAVDVSKAVASASTVAELKATWPQELRKLV